jgi:hypothetical protein
VISPSQRPLPTQDNTTYKHKRQTSMPRAEFEPAIQANKRPLSYALDRAETGIGRACHQPRQLPARVSISSITVHLALFPQVQLCVSHAGRIYSSKGRRLALAQDSALSFLVVPPHRVASCQFHTLAATSRGKCPRYPLDTNGWPQTLVAGNETRSSPPAASDVIGCEKGVGGGGAQSCTDSRTSVASRSSFR